MLVGQEFLDLAEAHAFIQLFNNKPVSFFGIHVRVILCGSRISGRGWLSCRMKRQSLTAVIM
jgi:hypothetical protein